MNNTVFALGGCFLLIAGLATMTETRAEDIKCPTLKASFPSATLESGSKNIKEKKWIQEAGVSAKSPSIAFKLNKATWDDATGKINCNYSVVTHTPWFALNIDGNPRCADASGARKAACGGHDYKVKSEYKATVTVSDSKFKAVKENDAVDIQYNESFKLGIFPDPYNVYWEFKIKKDEFDYYYQAKPGTNCINDTTDTFKCGGTYTGN